MRTLIALVGIAVLLSGCAEMAPRPPEPSPGHISSTEPPDTGADIPPLVERAVPDLPEPAPAQPQEKYTVVVHEVPVNELLFALARDANVNVDIDPRVSGIVTLNAVDQTLPQLLDRIARQVDIRYELVDGNLYITPDEPFFRTYRVNYLGMSRQTTGSIALQTSISASSGGSGTSGGTGGGTGGQSGATTGTGATNVNIQAANDFWATLVASINAIIGGGASGGPGAAAPGRGQAAASSRVIPYPETGLLTVHATARQHEIIQNLIDSAVESAQRQVLIQATIAEVTLNDRFQAGIDWSFLTQAGRAGFSLSSTLLPAAGSLGEFSQFVLQYEDPDTEGNKIIDAQVRLLEEFGDVSILSSPQIMTLNNQTAILKVVDDVVYFEIDSETSQSQTSVVTTFDTEPRTVSVGVTMAVTPQINSNDSVILNVRPSISRVLRFVQDPNPDLPVNPGVPELRVREMESILRLNSGQVAVLGGLMENNNSVDRANTPIISRLPGLGELFKSRSQQFRKTELVIFLRPLVIRNPGLDGDLRQYKTFLERRQ